MELKDFIKTTLRELSEALDESGIELSKKIMLTNVVLRSKRMGNYGLIEFDLAIEAGEAHKTGISGGASIKIAEGKINKENESSSSSISRIKFTVEADFDSFHAQNKVRDQKSFQL